MSTQPSTVATTPDERFRSLVEEHFRRSMERDPVAATFLGIHEHDERLADTSRGGVEARIADARRFLADVEGLDPDALSPGERFDRELVIHAVRLELFEQETHRVWERRATAVDEIGDGLFSLFVRDFAPLERRLAAMTARLEEAPRVLGEQRTRIGPAPVRLWNELELESAGRMPSLLGEIEAAAHGVWAEDSAERRRLGDATSAALAALEDYKGWLRELIARSGDDFPLGGERYDELVRLRAFDALTSDEILEIGEQQLAANHAGRVDVARRIDPEATEREVVERVRSDHPETFEEALEGYREAMFRARQHLIDRDLITIPATDELSVIPTPDYLRNVMPFAAYFSPPPFDERPSGIYVVTPSVDADPNAMREHSRSSISNTSIHEAYPGHHLQLSAAITHPSLARLLVDAPEFVEGWGMYSEQMMREEGFDAAPPYLLTMYTDAIWRSCRIILDVKLHRGEVDVAGAIDFLVEQTGFERPNATAEVRRYTYTPTYQLSYLLGKVMLLRLREDEQRRLRAGFSLKRFHDGLVYAGSLPISFQRRSLAGEDRVAASGAGSPTGR